MIAVEGLGVPLWVIWGFGVIIISMVLGATLIRRAGGTLSALAARAEPGDPRIRGLQQRLLTLNGHTSRVYSVACVQSARRIFSASWDGSVRAWKP